MTETPSLRGDGVRVADMLEAAALLDGIREKGREAFLSEPYLQAAAVRFLEVIGEAAGHLSESFRTNNPEIPVRKMRGFASLAKHEYWRVEVTGVWNAVEAMPSIRRALETARTAGKRHPQ
jgi:uncharacterized protein with HEPN domain